MSKSNITVRVFKYRLYPKPTQTHHLFRVLNSARHLYNMALDQHRAIWQMEQRSATGRILRRWRSIIGV